MLLLQVQALPVPPKERVCAGKMLDKGYKYIIWKEGLLPLYSRTWTHGIRLAGEMGKGTHMAEMAWECDTQRLRGEE